ncbi:MAG: restriction endonuclease subunit S, partial [Actinobacteria bacterium]|nr:restriction endonuclease subunit S [Actinomycetota bacterium]
TQRLSTDGMARSRFLPAGTLIMSIAATVGLPIITGIPACIHDGFVALERLRGVDKRYLLYVLKSLEGELRSAGQTGSQANVNTAIVNDLRIKLPPEREQRRIAEALADIDDLIATLERMITKRQAIKQGMMQQLLTGKTRLPGFTDPGREITLGDVLTVRHGKGQKGVESANGRYPILATGGQIGWARSPLYSKPSVLIGRKGTIDRPQFQATPFWTVDTLFYTEISASADPRYLYYVFLTVDWRSMNEASGVPSLSARRVESVEVRLPDTEEQRAIRSVLDDADAEINLLKHRLVKARSIKQGMMQELLTGRTRLPVQKVVS